jgi:DNA-binding XRE family transcriptional regulator
MNEKKREALEAAGWVFGSAEDFLELSAEERWLVDFRLRMARAIRKLRKFHKWSQTQLAKKMNTSQPRVAQIEAGAPGVSIEQMISSFMTLGGSVDVTLHEENAFDDGGVIPVGRGRGKRSVKTGKTVTSK